MTFFSDDARAFLQSVLRSEENTTLLLKGYSLGNYAMGKFRQETRLKKICLNLILLCQPDFVADLFSKGAVSGLLGRFFVCDYLGDLRSRNPKAPPINSKTQHCYNRQLAALVRGIRMREEPLYVGSTDEANRVLWSYGDANIRHANQSAVRINELVPRREEKAARLALNLHAAKWGTDADKHRLSPETAEKAIQLARWFASYETALFAENNAPETRPIPGRIVSHLTNRDWVKEREICQNLRLSKDELLPYLDQTERDGILERRTRNGTGPSSAEYRLVRK
jgi:hypothetical protein